MRAMAIGLFVIGSIIFPRLATAEIYISINGTYPSTGTYSSYGMSTNITIAGSTLTYKTKSILMSATINGAASVSSYPVSEGCAGRPNGVGVGQQTLSATRNGDIVQVQVTRTFQSTGSCEGVRSTSRNDLRENFTISLANEDCDVTFRLQISNTGNRRDRLNETVALRGKCTATGFVVSKPVAAARPVPGKPAQASAGCVTPRNVGNDSCKTADAVQIELTNTCGRPVSIRACIEGIGSKPACRWFAMTKDEVATHYTCRGRPNYWVEYAR